MNRKAFFAAILGMLGIASAQANQYNVPATLPGDVLYIDATTQGAYLLWHNDTKRFEVIAPYTQEQVFHLLLMREQAAWEALYWQMRSTVVKPTITPMPGRGR